VSIWRDRDRRLAERASTGRSRLRRFLVMAHPVIHTEIRSEDPDATRQFYADLFDWKV
jgi:hypothetical protein